jgi:DNA topoisomerase-1
MAHKTLLIVESPSKVKTIGSYFKPEENVQVTATYGHLRSLPSKPNAIDFANGINFQWVVNKQNIFDGLIKMIKSAQEIVLATDCDREGEAISWHVTQLMKEKNIQDKIIHRITFQEITPASIRKALDNKRQININLVNGYLARLTEDYSCGFNITEKMWKKLRCGYSSAGRVQSPTLELIRAREEAIRKFIPKIFYSVDAWLTDDNKNTIEEAGLTLWHGEKITQDTIPNEETAKIMEKTIQSLKDFIITKSEIKKTKSRKPEPLKTSSLQQMANSRLSFDGKKTMMVAQSLYEGVNIQDKITGLITYMRTDSTFLNEDFIKTTQDYIAKKYGKDYVDSEKLKAKKSKNAQEAHEAIRPTNVEYHPDEIKKYLTKEQHSLYSLIWNATVGSIMAPAEYANLNVILDNNTQNNHVQLKKTFKSLIFEGNLILDAKKTGGSNYNLDQLKLVYKEKNIFHVNKVTYTEHKTMAPPRYNSGSLVEEMETLGLGRPSTYAPTMDSLDKYKYFSKNNNAFVLTPKGATVSLFLQNYFPRFLKSESTVMMEEDLDAIANGEKQWDQVVQKFITDLNNNTEEVGQATTMNILETVGPKIFTTFNITNECKKCQKPAVVLAVKMNLFFKCTACNDNVPLDNLLNENIEQNVGEKYTIKNSIYGVYIANNETKKNISFPIFLDYKAFTLDDLEWFNTLPLEVDTGLFLKATKYGFYLEKGEIKVPLGEKSLAIVQSLSKDHMINLFEEKSQQPSKKSSFVKKVPKKT